MPGSEEYLRREPISQCSFSGDRSLSVHRKLAPASASPLRSSVVRSLASTSGSYHTCFRKLRLVYTLATTNKTSQRTRDPYPTFFSTQISNNPYLHRDLRQCFRQLTAETDGGSHDTDLNWFRTSLNIIYITLSITNGTLYILHEYLSSFKNNFNKCS